MRVPVILSATALAVSILGSTPVGEAARALVLPKNSVGTAQLRKDAVTAAKVKDGTLVAADFKKGEIPAGPAGPTGAQGGKGERGEKGDAATQLWAVVNRDGSIARQSGGVTSAKGGIGFYSVTFDRDVSNCALLASAERGWATISQISGRRAIFVDVYDGISRADWLFHIGAFC